MRDRIKQLAQELLVKYGVRGCTFSDIAKVLSITRANVHYHFGSKSALIDEAVASYISMTTDRFRSVWVNESKLLEEKVHATIAINRSRYDYFNSTTSGQSWSLITRMRGEEDALSAKSVAVVHQFTVDLYSSIMAGMEQAVRRGELSAEAPLPDVVTQLVNIINCAGLTTMDTRSFERLEAIYRGFLRMLLAAYGSEAERFRSHPT
ncbi:TetR/AcrR family transcriptional regulator [Variovorax boronicumulans]